MARYSGHIKENVAPYAAQKIGVYNSSGTRIGEIPLAHFKPTYGERLYRFGIMSDMHYNDTDDNDTIQDDGSNYHYDLICALKYFNEKEDVSFICAAGDVSTNYITQVKIYHDAIQDNYPSELIFTCKGNHDNAAAYNNDALWKQYTYPTNNPYTTYFFDSSNPTNLNITSSSNSNSFYFLKPLESDSTKQDVFVFFSLDYNKNDSNSDGSTYYSSASITWLSTLLEQYKNNRVFLFTHLFFWKKAGNCNEYYYPGNHSSQYVLFGDQYTTLNNLNNQYKNVIWFTGHSHYKWDYQPQDTKGTNGPTKRCNVCNYDKDAQAYCAYNVHIPSLARPLLNSLSYSVDSTAAQCGVVDVYEDCVVVRGIDMTNSTSGNYTYTTKYLPVAQYRLPVSIEGVNSADERDPSSVDTGDTPSTKTTYTVQDTAFDYSRFSNITDGETILCALSYVSRDASQLGVSDGSWSMSSWGSSTYTNYGTSITDEQSEANEASLQQYVQANVTANPSTYVFKLTRSGSSYILKSLDGTYYLTGSTATTGVPSWGTSETSAEPITFMNATGTSASSPIVTQTNNTKLLRMVGSNSSSTYLYYDSSSPYWTTSTSGGWTLMYMWLVTTSESGGGSSSTTHTPLTTSSSWTTGIGVSSTSGADETKAKATATGYIAVDSSKHYYLSAKEIYTTTNTDGLWCISIYTYDSSKNFLGRVTGSSHQATRTSGSLVYFDAKVDGTWEESYTDFDVTDYIFANSDTAYVRVKYEYSSDLTNYADLLTESINGNYVQLSEG